jgi:hypothetical protein
MRSLSYIADLRAEDLENMRNSRPQGRWVFREVSVLETAVSVTIDKRSDLYRTGRVAVSRKVRCVVGKAI